MTRHDVTEGDSGRATRDDPASARWIVVSRPPRDDLGPASRPERLLALVALGAVLVLVVSGLVGVLAARKLAERQAVNSAANTADLLAEAIVQPLLTDTVPDGDPATTRAIGTALDQYLGNSNLVRVKLWTRDGRIVYSDEPRLVGRQYELSSDAREVFAHPATRSEVSDLGKPENQFERGHGRLLEAYRPVWTLRAPPCCSRPTPRTPTSTPAPVSCGAGSPGSPSAACSCSPRC